MKRIIYLLAISCFLLISCHDDDRFSVENVVGNNTSIVGMWLREAGKEQMVYAFFEDGTGYEKTTDRRNNTVSVDGFTYGICNRLLLNILQVISQKYGLNL